MKCRFLLFIVLLLTGCASKLPPQDTKFNLKPIDRLSTPPAFIDSTDTSIPSGNLTRRVARDAFEPPLIDILMRRISAEVPMELQGKVIDVRAAYVDAYVNAAARQPSPIFFPAGAAGVAGVAIGHGLISLLTPGEKISFMSTFEVKVGDQIFSSQGSASVEARDAQRGVVETVETGITNLLARLRRPSASAYEPISEPPGAVE